MPTAVATPPKTSRTPRATAAGGYRKGDEARQRILEAALKAFGADAFKGATTRRIAQDAGVSLPALKYYFGGKEGLYLACAEEIVGRYRARMLGTIGEAQAGLAGDMQPERARAALKAIVGALSDLLIGAQESEMWMSFVLREMADQGPAFRILYEQVWAPGVELIALLISCARSEAETSESARIEALLLISSLSAFSVARPVALKYLAWPDVGGERFASINRIIGERIDSLGR